MRLITLVSAVVLLHAVAATHYRGGTFYWEKLSESKIKVYWRMAFQLIGYYPEYYCTHIGQELVAETLLALECNDCPQIKNILSPLSMECASISQEMGWSILKGSTIFQADVPIFQMIYHTTGPCTDSSWVKLENYGPGRCWSLLTDVDTTIENNSPRITAGLPVYRVRQGCKRVIDLSPTDPDISDTIRCRWANSSALECPMKRSASDLTPVCDQPTEITYLDKERCTIQFETGEDDLPGWYGASVMIEDFSTPESKIAKSTVPYQFLLDVTQPGSCIGPVIQVDECTVIAPGESYRGKVIAYIPPGSDGNIITEIQGSWPDEMTFEYTKHPPSTRVQAIVTFSAWKEGTYAFSFTATDDNGVQNDPKTGRIVVTVQEKVVLDEITPPQVLPELSYPTAAEPLDLERSEWHLTFDQKVSRPKGRKRINVIDVSTRRTIASYDASKPKQVRFKKELTETVYFNAPTNLKDGQMYYVEVEKGFAEISVNDACFKSATKASDEAGLFFHTPKPKEPVVDCGDHEITFYLPRYKVDDMEPSMFHLHDPRCKAKHLNDTFMVISFGYDECGTLIKNKGTKETRFYNTLRDDPEPYEPNSPISRKKRRFEMKIKCVITGIGVSDIFYDPDTVVKPTKHRGLGRMKSHLTLYEDSSYSSAYKVKANPDVALNQSLYFSVKAVDESKELQIMRCFAFARDRTCSKFDAKYEFVTDGCPVDDTVEMQYSHLEYEKRFSISAFAFLNFGYDDNVIVKCSAVTCKRNDRQSACAQLEAQRRSCVNSRGRRAMPIEKQATDEYLETLLPINLV
ncbi:uncharacterized protein LOC117112175 [Anneissia japonica]|uniref:uncharacterized protein LOC117112175 n=1 Tax=Anneissia japonica TaxID=1529436 RepID=UPI001425697B|nr:uncharacterized protein LOC117112175 [Anneissia japonica]